MFILGINAHHADASAAIFENGNLIAATEEERFRRVKHWAGFPSEAILFCLREAGISLDQLDHIAIGRNPRAKLAKKAFYLLKHPTGGWNAVKDRIKNAKLVSSLEDELVKLGDLPDSEIFKKRMHQVEHHRSHLASAFFVSAFEDAALLSIDGSGDFTTTMTGVGHGNSLDIFDSVDFPHSLGLFYTAFTQLLGFPHYGDEYKIMGLAPYGQPVFTDELKDILRFKSDGLFALNPQYFRPAKSGIISYGHDHVPRVAPLYSDILIAKFGKPRNSDEPLTQGHKDLAASVQKITEDLIFHMLRALHEKTHLENVCIAGGVGQNSVANGKITRNTPFKRVYVPAAAHDAGIAIGAALYVYNQVLRSSRPKHVRTAFTGARFDGIEIENLLKSRNISYQHYPDSELYEVVSDRIIQSGVIGWFTGRAEFGPRALGARSILADPRRPDAKDLLNSKIKRRESFRPFAPSILREFVGDYFEIVDEVPFMEKVYPVKMDMRSKIPAVTHVDGTGRLQTVDKEISPRYYQLIESFRKKTGLPILLNTSFNENEPIVNSPDQALECFLRTNMDMLVLENFVVSR